MNRILPKLLLVLSIACSNRITSAAADPAEAQALNQACQKAYDQHRFEQAEQLCQRALQIADAMKPPQPSLRREILGSLGTLYRDTGKLQRALPLLTESLQIAEATLPAGDSQIGMAMDNLGVVYTGLRDYEKAEQVLLHARKVLTAALKPDSADLAICSYNLADLYKRQGRYAKAEDAFTHALSIERQAYGEAHPEYGVSQLGLAELYVITGRYPAAIDNFERGLAVLQQGGRFERVFEGELGLSEAYRLDGQHAKSEATAQQLLAKARKRKDVIREARALHFKALALRPQERLAEAETVIRQSISIYERHQPDTVVYLGQSVDLLGNILLELGRHVQAEVAHKRALKLRQETFGRDHAEVAHSLNNLGSLYENLGRLREAEQSFRDALAIRVSKLGERHPLVAATMNSLAGVYLEQGNQERATLTTKQALELTEAALGPKNPAVGFALARMADVYTRGYAEHLAEPYLRRALDLRVATLAPGHSLIGESKNNLATLLEKRGQLKEAEQLFRDALQIWEGRVKANAMDVALALNNLGTNLLQQQRFDEAETHLSRALNMRRVTLGEEHLLTAQSLNNLARLSVERGNLKQAEARLRRALAIKEKAVFAPLNPDSDSLALLNLATVELASKRLDNALPLLQKRLEIGEQLIQRTHSEVLLEAVLSTHIASPGIVYALLAAHPDSEAVIRLALKTVLLNKGRSATAGAAVMHAVQRSLTNPEQLKRFQHLQELTAQREQLAWSGPGKLPIPAYREQLQKLDRAAQEAENLLAVNAPALQSAQLPQPAQIIEQVLQSLPPNSMLLEIVQAAQHDFTTASLLHAKQHGPPIYVAILLAKSGALKAVRLPEVSQVDSAVGMMLDSISREGQDVTDRARAVHRLIIEQLKPHLIEKSQVYLSLEGSLNLLPFDAIFDGTNYLIDRYRFHYLTAGRDLLRQPAQGNPSAPLVMADPDFQQTSSATAAGLGAMVRGLKQLSGARKEAEFLARLLKGPVLVGKDASEATLRARVAPRIMHLATHGIFGDDDASHEMPPDARVGVQALRPRVEVLLPDLLGRKKNSLSRSALVLAASTGKAGEPESAHDGILTAEEVRVLDLWGTQLVVLAACETGRGQIAAEHGVYGLRRSFLTAGAETLVTSLWRVGDQATSQLMRHFYENLLGRTALSPGAAMHVAMQKLRENPSSAHPYYWAPFIVIGRDAPLDGRLPPGPN